MTTSLAPRLCAIAAVLLSATSAHAADEASTAAQERLARVVDDTIRPVMAQNQVPGMAVAVTVRGKSYVFNYGLASKADAKPVTEHTMFELGSVSKTFTATLASYAAQRGALSFADKASQYLPGLAGSSFDAISLLELGTYTAGGLPLQFPDAVTTPAQMLAYFRDWEPEYAPGTHRRYSNPSIGLFGYLAARSMGEPFDNLMEHRIFPGLGLKHTFIRVPQARMGDYAYGYKDDRAIRVNPGMFDSEAYGVKTTAADMIRFVEANIDGSRLNPLLQRAIAGTHTGYFRVGPMTQGLGWEMYAWPTSLDDLLAGNASGMVLEASEVSRLAPPQPPRTDVLINKTGTTNGFGAYVVFVPTRQIGVVMLANKNLPIPDRVRAAYRILTALDAQ